MMSDDKKTRNYIRRRTIKLNCVWCGTEFEAKRKDSKYCSPSCRVMAFENQKAEKNSKAVSSESKKSNESQKLNSPPKRVFQFRDMELKMDEINDLSVCQNLINYFVNQRLRCRYGEENKEQREHLTEILEGIRRRRDEIKLAEKFKGLLSPNKSTETT